MSFSQNRLKAVVKLLPDMSAASNSAPLFPSLDALSAKIKKNKKSVQSRGSPDSASILPVLMTADLNRLSDSSSPFSASQAQRVGGTKRGAPLLHSIVQEKEEEGRRSGSIQSASLIRLCLSLHLVCSHPPWRCGRRRGVERDAEVMR